MASYPYKDTLLCRISKDAFDGFGVQQISISEDGRYVCFLANNSSIYDKKEGDYTVCGQILICDIKKHSHNVVNCDEVISSICFGKKDHIVASIHSLKSDYNSKPEMPVFYETAENDYSMQLRSYQADSGELVWESKAIDTYDRKSDVIYRELRFAGEEEYKKCYIQGSGDLIVLYDAKDGSFINELRGDGRLERFITGTSIRTDSFYCLDESGINCIVPSKEEGSYYYHYYLLDNPWIDIIVNSFENGVIVTSYYDAIKVWRNDFGDEGIPVSGSSRKNDYSVRYYSVGSYLVTLACDDNDRLKYHIDFYDVHQREHTHSVELSLEKNSLSRLEYIGSSEKDDYILVGDNKELLFFIVNVRNGDFQRIDLMESIEEYLQDGCSLENTESCLKNGKLILHSRLVDEDFNYQIVEVQYNVDNEDINYNSLLELDSKQNEFIWNVDEEGSMAYCFMGDGREILIDLDDKKKYEVRKKERNEDFYSPDTIHAFWDNETKKAVFYEGESIIVVDTSDGQILYEEENDGVSRIGLHGNDLYYLENEGIFKQVNYMNKEIVGSVSINQYDDMKDFSSDDGRGTFIYNSDSILLFLFDSYAIEINTDDLQIKSTIHNIASYNPSEDCFCIECTDYDGFIHSKDGNYNKYLSIYPRYSLDDLIKKGKDLTQGRELDKTTKMRYGIE